MTWVFNNPDPERNHKFAPYARAIVSMIEGTAIEEFKSKCVNCNKKKICEDKSVDKCLR